MQRRRARRFVPGASGLVRVVLAAALTLVFLLAGSVSPVSAEDLSAGEFYNQLGSASRINQFGGGRTLYVFYDPQCPYCAAFYHRLMDLKDEVRKVGVSVGWIPVAYLNRRSSPQAQTQLNRGIEELKSHFEGQRSPFTNDDQLRRAVEANTELMNANSEASATPSLVFRTDEGVHIISGAPDKKSLRRVLKAIR